MSERERFSGYPPIAPFGEQLEPLDLNAMRRQRRNERERERRANESPETRARRLERRRQRSSTRARQLREQVDALIDPSEIVEAPYIESESSDADNDVLGRQRRNERERERRANESPETRARRLERRRQRSSTRARDEIDSSLRSERAPEIRNELYRQERRDESSESHLLPIAHRRCRSSTRRSFVLCKAGFHYEARLDYRVREIDIGPLDKRCQFYGVFNFHGEPAGICCANGKVLISPIKQSD